MRTGSGRALQIIGAGGHGRVAADCARTSGLWDRIEFLDDRWPGLARSAAWPVVGNFETALRGDASDTDYFVAIGDAKRRMEMLQTLKHCMRNIATIVHRNAVVSSDVQIGSGTLVVAGAVVNIGATIGEGCIVNTASSVDHDCVLLDGVHVCPGAHLSGTVTVGYCSWVGVGAVARQNVRIGAHVMVAAGAVVVNDIADGLVVFGVPARPRAEREISC